MDSSLRTRRKRTVSGMPSSGGIVMSDPTEQIRRRLVAQINTNPKTREELEAEFGEVWDTIQLGVDFEVIGFMAPFTMVRRKSDGKKGTLTFQHNPRFYFDFVEAEG
jgi:hypothetical protein